MCARSPAAIWPAASTVSRERAAAHRRTIAASTTAISHHPCSTLSPTAAPGCRPSWRPEQIAGRSPVTSRRPTTTGSVAVTRSSLGSASCWMAPGPDLSAAAIAEHVGRDRSTTALEDRVRELCPRLARGRRRQTLRMLGRDDRPPRPREETDGRQRADAFHVKRRRGARCADGCRHVPSRSSVAGRGQGPLARGGIGRAGHRTGVAAARRRTSQRGGDHGSQLPGVRPSPCPGCERRRPARRPLTCTTGGAQRARSPSSTRCCYRTNERRAPRCFT
jgi:hypothetical protein